ncbi:hypothetical protein, partial [Lactiplantibacillus plantarum]|uniref:hypothetical protein n=1 Tax=Lactiplantibacillus plantarum TaxID=1590 RepID=UPI003854B6B1
MCVRIWRDGQSSGHHVLGRTSTFTPITRSPAQKSACKDLSRNGQRPAITAKAAYTPTSNRAGSRSQKKSRFQTTP